VWKNSTNASKNSKRFSFWLEQNTNALKATIQALEVQKMTLSTLQGMNVNMTELSKAFTAKMPDLQPKDMAKSEEAHSATGSSSDQAKASDQGTAQGATQGPAVDPMQWWGSLTQQFQNIAAAAVKDVAAKAMKDGPKSAKKRAATSKTRKPSASTTRSGSTRSSSARPSRAKNQPHEFISLWTRHAPQWQMAAGLVIAQLRAQMTLPGHAPHPRLGLLYITDAYANEAEPILAHFRGRVAHGSRLGRHRGCGGWRPTTQNILTNPAWP
jgi:hypothetical protein